MAKKYTFIDLFSGCGGLSEGFMQSGYFDGLAHVEWEIPMVNTLRRRLETKWGETEDEAKKKVILFDIQKTDELINGNWSKDSIQDFGEENAVESKFGLRKLIGEQTVDLIIGGPPCQAYSIHGRATDKNSMKDDYRNYLFESFVKVVNAFRPKAFIFENVKGMLRYLLPLSFFSVGILIACILREKSKSHYQSLHWHQKVLILEILLLLTNAFIPLGKYDILANSLISLSCAIQVEAFQHFLNINAATTMCIGNIKNGMENLFHFFVNKNTEHLKKAFIYIGIILFFGIGSVIGIICTAIFREKAILVCIALLVLLIFLIQSSMK